MYRSIDLLIYRFICVIDLLIYRYIDLSIYWFSDLSIYWLADWLIYWFFDQWIVDLPIYWFIDFLIYWSMQNGVRHVGYLPHTRPLQGSADYSTLSSMSAFVRRASILTMAWNSLDLRFHCIGVEAVTILQRTAGGVWQKPCAMHNLPC